jgi:O-methyltransferase domain/Dimerisation domain
MARESAVRTAPDAAEARDAADVGDAARRLVDIVTASWAAQAVFTAVKLGIPDHVAAGRVRPDELATAAGADPDGVRRLMRLLVDMDVFDGSERSGYRLTPVSELLCDSAPRSMRDLCLLYGDEFYRAWGRAPHAISTGRPAFDEAFGAPLQAYLRNRTGASAKFQRAMNAGSPFFADVPRAFHFPRYGTVVDVAGGTGTLLATILREHPGCRGVLMDLPHVVAAAREQAGSTPGLERCQIVAGNLFESVPSGGDVYLLSRVLQDWDDAACVQALMNCRRAMRRSSTLLILERVIPDERPTNGQQDGVSLSLLWDLHLLMMTAGRERALDEYRGLLRRAGLRLESLSALPLEMTMLVARRA